MGKVHYLTHFFYPPPTGILSSNLMKRGVGYWQKTGKSAKFGQKIGTFTHIKPKFAIFVHFYIFTDILTISYWTQ